MKSPPVSGSALLRPETSNHIILLLKPSVAVDIVGRTEVPYAYQPLLAGEWAARAGTSNFQSLDATTASFHADVEVGRVRVRVLLRKVIVAQDRGLVAEADGHADDGEGGEHQPGSATARGERKSWWLFLLLFTGGVAREAQEH